MLIRVPDRIKFDNHINFVVTQIPEILLIDCIVDEFYPSRSFTFDYLKQLQFGQFSSI